MEWIQNTKSNHANVIYSLKLYTVNKYNVKSRCRYFCLKTKNFTDIIYAAIHI